MEDHQWRGVVEAMGSPSWAESFSTTEARIEGADEIDRRIGEWVLTLTKSHAETLLQAHGVPATASYSPEEIITSPQLAHRESLESVTIAGDGQYQIVGSPYRLACAEECESGSARTSDKSTDADELSTGVSRRRQRSLRGLRVLEVGHVLAAPLAAAVLGALGADVTKLEDVRRLDMYRRRGPYIDSRPETNWSAYFALVNHSKRSFAIDVDSSRGHLRSLLGDADVVIENLGARRARHLGLAASQLGATYPHLLAVSSSGYGQDGPCARYRAYAYNLHASAGLAYLTRNEAGQPAEVDLPWADLISGYALASVIAAWTVGPAGNDGSAIDFAMADLVIGRFNEFIAAASIDPESDANVDRANELAPYAPNGVYATSDGWIAISVADDDTYRKLVEILQYPSLSLDEFAGAGARFDMRRELDIQLNEATGGHKAADLAIQLRSAGIIAEELVPPADVPASNQLKLRGFFAQVDHPEWGTRRLIGIPWRRFGDSAIPLGPPPCLVRQQPIGPLTWRSEG